MADNFTNYGRRLLVTGNGEPSGKLDWIDDTIRVVLINAGRYTFDVTHRYLSDIPSNARVFITDPLAGKIVTATGACGASNVEIPSLSGDPVGALGLFKDVSGIPAQSPFLMWIDSYGGLPTILTGGKFRIFWPTDANKIFRP